MLRTFILCFLLALSSTVLAQRRITVLHSTTGEPIPGVTVRCDSIVAKTDQHGRVSVPEQFDSISFSHLEFAHECLRPAELTDTMYLFPRKYQLKEVTVTGIGPDLRGSIDKARERWLEGPRSSSLLSFDIANILDRRGRRDRKQLRRIKEVLREFDAKP